MFTLPKLPYEYNSLEPHIDAQTMEIHHSKHHQTYVDKLNAALENHQDLMEKPVEELLKTLDQLPEEVRPAVKNHGGGHANHSMFWEILSPNASKEPEGALKTEIEKTWVHFDEFKTKFNEAATAHFGSGWAWLGWSEEEGLHIHSLPNQENPLSHGHFPVMGVDVWEHAYYLKYQNRRPEYLTAIWNVLDWKKISERFDKAVNS